MTNEAPQHAAPAKGQRRYTFLWVCVIVLILGAVGGWTIALISEQEAQQTKETPTAIYDVSIQRAQARFEDAEKVLAKIDTSRVSPMDIIDLTDAFAEMHDLLDEVKPSSAESVVGLSKRLDDCSGRLEAETARVRYNFVPDVE